MPESTDVAAAFLDMSGIMPRTKSEMLAANKAAAELSRRGKQ